MNNGKVTPARINPDPNIKSERRIIFEIVAPVVKCRIY